jgi:membrane protease YdiL (CAAX protease family)
MMKKVEEFEIKMRSQSVGTLCFFSLLTIIMIADHNARPECSILTWFGLKIDLKTLKFTLLSLLLNSVLFIGEIFQIAKGMVIVRYSFDILAFKNLVFAPLFEEFIYRVCLINIFMEAGALTESQAVFVLPVFFAISHVHHVYKLRKEEKISKRKALLMCAFQVMYT